MRANSLTGLAVAATLLLTSCGGGETAEPGAAEDTAAAQLNVDGVLVLADGGFTRAGDAYGDPCQGDDGYDDIVEGAQVVVRDSGGESVGLAGLQAGYVNNRGPALQCEFAFSVDGVPDEGDLFSVEVAGRGEITFRRDEATHVRVFLG